MLQTLPATDVTVSTPRPPTHGASNHSVGIEPLPPALRWTDSRTWNARVMVVERYNGQLITLVTTDTDAFNDLPLDDVVKQFADRVNATAVAPVWPICPWCTEAYDVCPDRFGHDRANAGSETAWR